MYILGNVELTVDAGRVYSAHPFPQLALAPVRNDAVKALPDEQPVWPIPRNFAYGKGKVLLSRDFHIKVQSTSGNQMPFAVGSYPILGKAITRFMDRLQAKRTAAAFSTAATGSPLEGMDANALSELTIIVENPKAALEYGMAESYTIKVTSKDDSNNRNPSQQKPLDNTEKRPDHRVPVDENASAVLSANTQWGVIHGLETFLQLVQANRPSSSRSAATATDQTIENLLVIPNTPWSIQDEPRYSHRGVLLDTSRNYFPLKDIIRTLDAMSLVKLNVFHWHVLDQQTYPLVSKAYPDLSAKGAERPDYVYTPEDVATIIKHGEEVSILSFDLCHPRSITKSWSSY